MQVTIEVADTMTAYVRKTGVERDMTKLPTAALVKIFEYGFQRINNDAGAVGKDETTADALAKADKKWNALVSGDIRVTRASGGDPVAREAKRLAEQSVKTAAAKQGKKLSKEDLAELVKQYAAREDVIAKAKANLEDVIEVEI